MMKALPTPTQVSATQIIMRIQDGDPAYDAVLRVIIRAHIIPQVAEAAIEYAKERGVIPGGGE